MTPIYKKGKDKKKAASYRPISRASCIVKTLEKIIDQRLHGILKLKTSDLPNVQASDSSGDQAAYLS